MDWLDRISIWAIVLLIISSFVLIAGHFGEAKPELHIQKRLISGNQQVVNPEIEAKVKLIRNLMETDTPAKAEALGRELKEKYPYEAVPHMIMGDILMRKQDPVRAMFEYKEAVDLDPDYLDRKTPLFQGKKMKAAASEALTEIEKRIRLNPADESMKRDRKIIYYMQRKIAGSCS